jgi:hypothetical protein
MHLRLLWATGCSSVARRPTLKCLWVSMVCFCEQDVFHDFKLRVSIDTVLSHKLAFFVCHKVPNFNTAGCLHKLCHCERCCCLSCDGIRIRLLQRAGRSHIYIYISTPSGVTQNGLRSNFLFKMTDKPCAKEEKDYKRCIFLWYTVCIYVFCVVIWACSTRVTNCSMPVGNFHFHRLCTRLGTCFGYFHKCLPAFRKNRGDLWTV